MTPSDALALVLAAIAGLLLGAIFFGGLCLTVRKGVSSGSPALWFFGSLVAADGHCPGRLLLRFATEAGNGWSRACWALSWRASS